MAGPSTRRKPKRTKSQRNNSRFTAGDYGLPESQISSLNWDSLSSDDDDETTSGKKEQTTRPSSSPKRYTRSRSERSRAVRFNEPIVRSQSERRQSPWIERMPAPSHPSTSREKGTSEDTAVLNSLHHEQQRLSAEQTKLAKDFKLMAAEQKKIKKKWSKISRLLKGILETISCSNSEDSD